jgi:hypothetical protein
VAPGLRGGGGTKIDAAERYSPNFPGGVCPCQLTNC